MTQTIVGTTASGPGRPAPRATLYLASAEDAEASRLEVAGLPVAFRAVMVALLAGCRSVAIPSVFRGTEVERAIGRSPRARANTVWLSGGNRDMLAGPQVLIPSSVVMPPLALRSLLEASPVAVLPTSPAGAPVILADRSVVSALEAELVAGRPAGEVLDKALSAGRSRVAGDGWCVRATSPDTRKLAEQRLYAELGSAADTKLDRLIHRPASRNLTRAMVALRVSPNAISLASLALGLLAVWCLARGQVEGALAGIVLYFAASVLDHVDGEVARLTYAESRLGEWLDVAVDTVVHAATALALGVSTERVAGTGFVLGVVTAIGFVLSAMAAKSTARGEDVPRVLTRLGNRDGFYLLLLAFLALLALAPAKLPALLLVAAVGSHVYWLGHVALRLRQFGRSAVFDDTV